MAFSYGNRTSSKFPTQSRLKLIIKALPFFVMAVVAIIGVLQLDVVRQFLGKASGEPANIFIDTQAVLGKIERPWRYLAQGGEGFDWRLAPLAGQVRTLKPQYIRIDHITDFYEIVKGTPGNLSFDFTKFDQILNDIQSVGAKPYISLSYMPTAISSSDIVGKPHRWEDWQLTVQKIVEHVSGTRGISDVYYEVWNEPDLFGGWKYYGSDKNYITMYNYAVRGANAARGVRPFKIGGPAITALYRNWFYAMAKNSVENGVRMDFFSWHRYSTDIDQFKKDMYEAQSWLQDFPQLEPTLELHITEWGHDSNNNAGYDSNYSAAHTVAGAIEMIGVVDKAFVFEIQDGKSPQGKNYWGRWGMFTHKDVGAVAKPRFRALQMLDRISDQRLQLLGKGSWVKGVAARSDAGTVQVVLSNYDARAQHSENVPVTFTNILPGTFTVSKEYLGGRKTVESVATTSAELKIIVPMSPNSVSFVELTPSGENAQPIEVPTIPVQQ